MPRYFVMIRRIETEFPHTTVSVEAPNEDAINAYEWSSELPGCCWHYNVGEGEITEVDIEEDETPTGEPDVVITNAGHKVNMQDADPAFTMSRIQLEALQEVVAYNWDDESEDYDSSEDEAKENHIFLSLRTLKTWLDALESRRLTRERNGEPRRPLPGLFYARHRTGAEPDSQGRNEPCHPGPDVR